MEILLMTILRIISGRNSIQASSGKKRQYVGSSGSLGTKGWRGSNNAMGIPLFSQHHTSSMQGVLQDTDIYLLVPSAKVKGSHLIGPTGSHAHPCTSYCGHLESLGSFQNRLYLGHGLVAAAPVIYGSELWEGTDSQSKSRLLVTENGDVDDGWE